MNPYVTSQDSILFSHDPFVDPRVCVDGRKKSVEEILEGINGFRTTDSRPGRLESVREAQKPQVAIVIEGSRQTVNAPTEPEDSSRIGRSLKPIKIGRINFAAECETPEIDIRDLTAPSTADEPCLEPIRGSFEHDPEYFEFFAIHDRIEQLERLDYELTQVNSPTGQAFETAAAPCFANESIIDTHGIHFLNPCSENVPSNLWAMEPSGSADCDLHNPNLAELNEASKAAEVVQEIGQLADELTEIIYAQDKQVIYVDGRDGFQYIDLSCFQLSQASFEANRIRIHTAQHDFEIDYRNVAHAVFADNQEVQLAAFESNFSPA
jgi:hypothetical protein